MVVVVGVAVGSAEGVIDVESIVSAMKREVNITLRIRVLDFVSLLYYKDNTVRYN